MAETYELEIQAQPGIYSPADRTIKIYFAEPEKGITKETGLLLLLAGYGGNAQSKIFAKMRRVFADEYNLITLQCDYFGYEYMQNNNSIEISSEMLEDALSKAELDLLNLNYEKYAHILRGKMFRQKVELGETPECFNDMGMMQAMDNLRAVKVVYDIVENNGYHLNGNRVYAYGFSHGAYLAYLCNAFCPGMFSAIVDNSAYLKPFYLKIPRKFDVVLEEGISISQVMEYKALEYVQDEEVLSLPNLYGQLENQAEIICFAGEDDWMTLLEDKKAFLNQVAHAKVETITKSRVDRVNFHNADHGLGADFLELFRATYRVHLEPRENERKKQRKKEMRQITFENVAYDTKMFHYEICWEDGVPVLSREKIG